jgi:hypothetical protein
MNLWKYIRDAVGLPRFLLLGGFYQQQPFGMGKIFNLSTSECKIESQTDVNTGDALAVRFHCPQIHEQFLFHHAQTVWAMELTLGESSSVCNRDNSNV